MYSFGTSVTHLPQRGQVLGRREVAQGLVGTHRVVRRLPGQEGRPQAGQRRLGVGDLVELLGVGPVRPLDAPVELGAPGRQGEQGDVALGTRLLELGHELRAVVDREGPDPERHPGREGVEDGDRRAGAGRGPQLEHVPARHHVAGRELLDEQSLPASTGP